jgi:hypothetical protein
MYTNASFNAEFQWNCEEVPKKIMGDWEAILIIYAG